MSYTKISHYSRTIELDPKRAPRVSERIQIEVDSMLSRVAAGEALADLRVTYSVRRKEVGGEMVPAGTLVIEIDTAGGGA